MTDNELKQTASVEIENSKSRLLRTLWKLLWPEMLRIFRAVAEKYAEGLIKKENEKLFGNNNGS